MPLRLLPEEETQIEIKDMLLRIAKLYQIPNFDAESAFLLSEWVMDEYKHSSQELVRRALSNPPKGKDKSWRLTPETISEWVEITRVKIIDEEARKESEARQSQETFFPVISDNIDKLLSETMANLKSVPNGKFDAKEVEKIKQEDKERREGRKALPSNRRNFTVTVEDSEGNYIGKYENVLAETQEQANEIVKKLVLSGQLRL